MISVINYGIGNIGSILSMYAKLGIPAVTAQTPEEILAARALILPGVGHFDAGMRALDEVGIRQALNDAVLRKGTPLLGICLGMQMLADSSEEGDAPGLGFIPGRNVKFRFPQEPARKVPNMGWLELTNVLACPLFAHPEEEQRFYFVHSYHMCCEETVHVAAQADYGGLFTAVVHRDNIWGTQFHPEKSHKYGMALLRGFASTVLPPQE